MVKVRTLSNINMCFSGLNYKKTILCIFLHINSKKRKSDSIYTIRNKMISLILWFRNYSKITEPSSVHAWSPHIEVCLPQTQVLF